VNKGFNYPYFLWPGNDSSGNNCIEPNINYTWYFVGARQRQPGPPSAADSDWLEDVKPSCFDSLPNAQRNAWHAMQPRFEGRISLINALFELKDFRDVMSTFSSLKPWKIPKMLHRGLPKGARKDPTKPLADVFLTNELAIKPLLRDISEVLHQIHTIVDTAQQEFSAAGDASQKSHYNVTLCEEATLGRISHSYAANSCTGKLDKTSFNATMEYQYNYRSRDAIAAFRKFWGLDLTYEALWNAAPWSFVWDYFMKVSKSIRNMERDLNVDLRMSQYCESITREKTVGGFLLAPSYPRTEGVPTVAYINGVSTADRILGSSPLPVCGRISSHYTRYVCAPNKGAALPFLSLPNTKQQKMMGALLRTLL
jgi:hypothetical protein